MGILDKSWMHKVDVVSVMRELGIEVKSETEEWINTYCPIHGESPSSNSASFAIALKTDDVGIRPPGIWQCRGCKAHGDIVNLYAHVKGITNREAFGILRHAWDPNSEEDIKPRVAPAPLPSFKVLETYVQCLWDDPDCVAHWTGFRGWSVKFLEDAKIGAMNGMLMIPIQDADGSLINVRTKPWRKRDVDAKFGKTKGLRGRPCSLYPLMLFDPQEELVITEGEPDVGALHSIGVNALTHTGGAGSLTWNNFKDVMPKGERACVTLCGDTNDVGRKAIARLRKECLKEGIAQVRVIKLPDGNADIESYLRNLSVEVRKAAWSELYSRADVYTHTDNMGSGLWVQDGKIVNDEGEEVAPFTATVKGSGVERYGQSEENVRSYLIELTHHTGSAKKIEVQMQTGDSFWEIVMNVGGPEWTFMRQDQDRLFHAICKTTAGEAEKIDAGFIFGFEDEKLTPFWAPGFSFGKEKVFETKEFIRMRAPTRFLRLFHMPVPTPSKVVVGLDLVLKHLYRSHKPWVMGPMIATAFAAPVRRIIMPTEQAFTVMIYGRSGCGKTSRAREVQNLFSGKIRDDAQLESWKSTIKAIQQMCSFAGDSWLLIDELRLPGMSNQDRREVLLMLQGMSQGAGRLALTSQRRFMNPPESRCILAATMESLPFDDDSQLARSVMIHVPMLDLLDPTWKKPHDLAQNGREFLPYAMSAWIHWLVTAPPEASMGPGNLDERARGYAEEICRKHLDHAEPMWRGVPNAPRLFQRGVLITTTWLMLLELARTPQYQVLNEGEYQNFIDEWMIEVLPRFFASSFANIQSAGMAEQFILALEMAITSGDAYYARRHGDGRIDKSERLPDWSAPQAKIIGLVIDVKPGTEDSIFMHGRNVRLMLNPAAIQLAHQRGVRTTWQEARQVMESYGLLAQKQTRLGNARGMWMSKKGLRRLLSPFVNPKAGEGQ